MVIFDFAFATLSGKLNHTSLGNGELVWVYLMLDVLTAMSAFDRGNIRTIRQIHV